MARARTRALRPAVIVPVLILLFIAGAYLLWALVPPPPPVPVPGLSDPDRLDLMPLQSSRWVEWLETHPSTMRRVRAVAEDSGVPPERFEELLREPPGEESYELPPAVTSPDTLFSLAYQRKFNAIARWAPFAAIVIVAIAFASAVPLAELTGISWGLAIAGGLAATVGAFVVARNHSDGLLYPGLRRRLRQKLESEGLAFGAAEAAFVGYCPSPTPRLYGFSFTWDFGFLVRDGYRLCYLGEQARFALRRDEIAEVRLGPGPPGWIPSKRVYVTWRRERTGEPVTFHLRPGDSRSLWTLRRDLSRLFDQVRDWLAGPTPAPAVRPALPPLPPPEICEVSSHSPRVVGRVRFMVADGVRLGLVTLVASTALGLTFHPNRGATALYAIGWAVLTGLVTRLPYRLHREPDRARTR